MYIIISLFIFRISFDFYIFKLKVFLILFCAFVIIFLDLYLDWIYFISVLLVLQLKVSC